MKKKKSIYIFFSIIFGVIALLNVGYLAFSLAHISSTGLVDFNTYWYSGLFVRQGVNPYQGFLENLELAFPISILGGKLTTTSGIITHPYLLGTRPGNTAPFILLMTLFSFLTIKTSSTIWSIINILFSILIPIFILYYLKNDSKLVISKYLYPISIIIFWSLNMTFRGVILSGQNTLLIIVLMLLTLILIDKGKIMLSGIILGIAVSKYNVAFPLLIFLIYKKHWNVLIVAIIIQILGIVLLSFITASTPIQILENYYSIALFHQLGFNNYGGINISDYFPKNLFYSLISFLLITIPLGGGLGYLIYDKMNPRLKDRKITEMLFLSTLFLWILLAVYHLGYDAVLTIFPVLLILALLINYKELHLSSRMILIIGAFTFLAVVLLIIPGSIFRFTFFNENASNVAMTSAVIILLFTNFLIIYTTRHLCLHLDSQSN